MDRPLMASDRGSALTTIADVLKLLGGIPAERVRVHPRPGTASERDVLAVHSREKRLCELVDGVLVEKTMGYYESILAGVLLQLLRNYLDEHPLGIAAGADGMMRLAPGLVRIPDVSVVLWERLPDHELPSEPIPDLVPHLAVEVLSQGNTEEEMDRKVGEYFSSGVLLVWLLDPDSRTMKVYTSPQRSSVIETDGVLDGGPVLPGFRVTLREIFERAIGPLGKLG
jgi:Uma2 family endonuclease